MGRPPFDVADIIYFVVVVGDVERVEKCPKINDSPKNNGGKLVDIYALSLDEMCKYRIQKIILLFPFKILPEKEFYRRKRRLNFR